METSPPLRRLTIAVDAESYSSRNQHGQLQLQRDLLAILHQACENGDLNRLEWDRQQQGDGELAILPPGTVEDRTISDFVGELDKALYHHNKMLNHEYRVRLRVAVHQGNIRIGDNGFVGKAVVAVCRMRDNDQVRRVLAGHPKSDLVLVVSESIYSDVIEEGTHALYRWRFDPIVIDEPAKDFRANAWIYVPDSASQPESFLDPDAVPADESGGSERGRSQDGPPGGRDRQGAPVTVHGDVTAKGGDVAFGNQYGDKRTYNRF
ncbi:hypothetical protein [Allosalinactinospora lopnorensis]|uniref:hypothetical protein n=1 Tax=Allosalinactinospora lopnorensis TaxID=1352348 RepID=UPI000ABE889D|nr:hypothetical protein [Allosalinactinospora lopnorensis]